MIDTFAMMANLDEAERVVKRAAEEIWARPVDLWYTDHSLQHSQRIVGHSRALQNVWQLNESELQLLRFAAYLHDIGMQFSDWGGSSTTLGSRRKATVAEALGFQTHKQSTSWIRQRHADLGRALIEAELRRQRTWQVPPAFSRVPTGHEADFLWNSARVAFAHTAGRTWDEFRRAKEAIEVRSPSGEPLRLWLLVGVLRIADELDGCKWRIPTFERISHADTPDESIPHWLACWFVEELRTSGSEFAIEVSVKWRVPDDADEEEVHEIRRLLQIFRRQKLQQTIDEVNTYFGSLERSAMHRTLHVRGLEDTDEPSVRWPAPEDRGALRSAVQSALVKGGWRGRSRGGRERKRKGQSGDLEIELRNWVLASRRGVRQGHFALERGLHTDRLVNCRSLGTRQELVRSVADWIASSQGAIDHCIAVGTSMIPFALETARRFNASVTFTFGVPTLRFDEQMVDRFTKIEVSPFLPNEMGRILILDDIIAVGEGAKKVIEMVREGAQGRRRLKFFHYSLFRFGSQKFFEMAGVEYRWACWIKDVKYWKPERCPKCRAGDVCVRESDIWG